MATLINNLARCRQVIDFEGIGTAPKVPADIDLIYDHRGEWFFIAEIKSHGFNREPFSGGKRTGQAILLENLANALRDAGRKVRLVVAEHYTVESQVVKAAECKVLYMYSPKRIWVACDGSMTLKEVFDDWAAWW